jgi:hypothetical protein
LHPVRALRRQGIREKYDPKSSNFLVLVLGLEELIVHLGKHQKLTSVSFCAVKDIVTKCLSQVGKKYRQQPRVQSDRSTSGRAKVLK